MNFGLLTSYVIGGMVLLAILMMNHSVSSSATEITLSQVTREKAATVSDMLAHDIQKIGYNRTGTTSPILTLAEGKKIRFRSNIDNSVDQSVETITWEFTDTKVSNSNNQNACILKRTVRDEGGAIISETPITLGVTRFRVSYFREYGKPLADSLSTPIAASDLSEIKQLYVALKLESGEKVFAAPGNPGRFVATVWEKRFSPPNLEL